MKYIWLKPIKEPALSWNQIWGVSITHFVGMKEDDFINEVRRIIESAQQEEIKLRVLGSVAVFIRSSHCTECIKMYKSLGRFGEGRPMFTDLDVVAYSRQSKMVDEFMTKKMKFQPNVYVNAFYNNSRGIYFHPEGKYSVDVFYDKLSFSHDVDFTDGRLDNTGYAIEPEDIILEKLQIHDVNRKDLIDLFVLFLSHDVSDRKEERKIDGTYIARLLANDWGFWYDAENNLAKVVNLIINEQKVERNLIALVEERILKLKKLIEIEPKTKIWEKRSKKGISKPWYNEVDEVER